MEIMKRASYILTALMVSGLLAGCFSYHREVEHTTAASPPPASSTTTTTTNDNGSVERQSTTTYSNP